MLFLADENFPAAAATAPRAAGEDVVAVAAVAPGIERSRHPAPGRAQTAARSPAPPRRYTPSRS